MANIPGKPFTDTLGELDNGTLHNDLTEAVYNIMAAVMETRKKGSLKLSISFTPTGRGTVEVAADFDASIPEHDRASTTFFVGKDLSLQRRDPNQPDLPLQAVEMPNNKPVRAI
jgi:hypothetical protein